jgi:hypothetical protein
MPQGSLADYSAGVKIGELYGGWFSNPAVMQKFFDIGVAPQLDALPPFIRYTDVGGGMGNLGVAVTVALREKGFDVRTTVVDGNRANIPFIRERGLEAQFGNIVSCHLPPSDLMTLRSVLHYNSRQDQFRLLCNIHSALLPGGTLVINQPTGTAAHCAMRGEVMTHRLLLTIGCRYSWPSCEELLALLDRAGFDTVFAGEIQPTYGWSAADQWERFNGHLECSTSDSGELEQRKQAFLDAAYNIFESYRRRYGDEWVRLEGSGRDDTKLLTYQPIYISVKKRE